MGTLTLGHFFISEPVGVSGSVTWMPFGETGFSSAVEREFVPSGCINSALLYVCCRNRCGGLLLSS